MFGFNNTDISSSSSSCGNLARDMKPSDFVKFDDGFIDVFLALVAFIFLTACFNVSHLDTNTHTGKHSMHARTHIA